MINNKSTKRGSRGSPVIDQFDVLNSFVDRCQNETSPVETVVARFGEAVQSLGFRYFAVCSHVDPLDPPKDAMVLRNYPDAWVRRFSEEKYYEFDPVLRRAQIDPRPFFWDVAFRAQQITIAQRRLLAEAAEFRLSHGFTVPLHLSWLPGSIRASCSVVPDDDDIDPHRALVVQALAHTLYACLHQAQVTRRISYVKLTPRERQCLALAAHGKTDWDIGHILHLSECTVHTHFQRLMERLGVCTRRQAIAYALVSGEISLTM